MARCGSATVCALSWFLIEDGITITALDTKAQKLSSFRIVYYPVESVIIYNYLESKKKRGLIMSTYGKLRLESRLLQSNRLLLFFFLLQQEFPEGIIFLSPANTSL